ncbi:LOW QUALITY PROTEIN: transcription factor mef2A-like [Sinocyclocheilus grahami]|uniref:LOW QUALITY PROTEIN: transcription factor mef2A-like n=1 Tax=Sinocyclocheilus grahami TaxID=75366 RepID=UPI0007ACF46B|nr:PREDICTED: LOW QUALITY PROTEIN: transcription factor mef2A-like [Sinocyclocheilus grahami]
MEEAFMISRRYCVISLPLAIVCLDPVPVQFKKTPVLVASGKDAVFTVQTVSDVSLIRWSNCAGHVGSPDVMSVPQYQGRISVTATQLKITNSQIRDSGNYSVSVEPSSTCTSGLGVNTRSVQLKVFDAVNGVSLSLPSLPLEGGNVSLSCSWSAGSEVSVVWGKGGTALSSDSRITISTGSLLIKQARRDDVGEYTCTVSNTVSAQTAKATLSVYYGPDAPQLTKTSSECVGGGDATVGQTVRLTCTSAPLPPASFSWELNDQPVTAGQSGSFCNKETLIRDSEIILDFRKQTRMTTANRAFVNGNHPDPTLHNSLPQNFTAIPNNNNGNINTMSQNMPSNSNPLHHNGHLNTDVFQHRFSTVPDNGHQNNSYPNNDPQRSFPQSVQHNPNILIQTGNSQPGALAPTVHENLNTLPCNDQFNNSQPQMVHVNLNTYPPKANQMVQQHAESALQIQHINSNHQNHSQNGLLNSDPLTLSNQTQNRDRSAPRYRETESSGRLTQAAPSPQRRDLQRPIVPNHSQMHPNVQRQSTQQNLSTQPQVQSQIQTAIPQTKTSQVQNPIPIGLPRGMTIPQTQTGTRPNQAMPQPSVPLTEAALRQHTAQTDNAFTNRIQQTPAALQNPGPSQPIQQLNIAGQRPPIPPPVLRLDEFQKLPCERMKQPQTIQPVNVQRRHRSPNVHRQNRVLHTSPQRMPGVNPMHQPCIGHPTHMRQLSRRHVKAAAVEQDTV